MKSLWLTSITVLFISCSLMDVEAPKISIKTPANNAAVSTTFLIQGTASDNVSLKSVQLSIDGGDYNDMDGKENWYKTVNINTLGGHTLSVRAEDYNENVSVKIIDVDVN